MVLYHVLILNYSKISVIVWGGLLFRYVYLFDKLFAHDVI